ncbi:TBC1D24 [Acrasis kona]|uniref:TBC1D24 n=1 Tax=Acrasis kona TaxID=1008807 RepID=A0AAW2YU83_9EUKA
MVDKLQSLTTRSDEEILSEESSKMMAWSRIVTYSANDKTLKALIRKGIPGAVRKTVWMSLAGCTHLAQNSDFYDKAFHKLYGSYGSSASNPIHPRSFNDFGGSLPENGILNYEGVMACKRVLNILGENHGDLEYCRMLPQLTYMFMSIMNEHETYSTLHCMVEISRNNKKYFRINKMQYALFMETFKDVIKKKVPNLYNHFEHIKFDMTQLLDKWFSTLFYGILPFRFCMRICDVFMSEGSHVLYRAAYAIFKTIQAKILECKSATYMINLIDQKCRELNSDSPFFKKAFELGLRRQHLDELDQKNRTIVTNNNQQQHSSSPSIQSKFIKPKVQINSSEIITDMNQWELLYTWLPYTMRVRSLHQIFSTTRDGYALSQLYKRADDAGACVIIMMAVPDTKSPHHAPSPQQQKQQEQQEEQDTNTIIELIKNHQLQGKSLRREIKNNNIRVPSNHQHHHLQVDGNKMTSETFVIGAYLGEAPSKTFHYAGTTDTFLFSMYPVEARYKWSKKNDYFVMGRNDKLVFGGGGDGPGLMMDEMMSSGSSQKCLTYDNEPLCGGVTEFNIIKVEMFSFK